MKYLLPAIVVAIVVSSCSGKKNNSDLDHLAASSEMLRYLPNDTPLVFGVRVANLLTSSFGETALLEHFSDKKGTFYRSEIKKKCGVDPWTVATNLIIVPGKGDDIFDKDEFVIGLQSNLDQMAFEECVVSMGGSVKDGLYSGKTQSIHAYWPASGIVFFSVRKTSSELKAWATEGNGNGNESLMSLIEDIDRKALIWAAGVVPEPLLTILDEIDQSPRSGHLGIVFDENVHVVLSMNFDTEATAKGMSSYIKMLVSLTKRNEEIKELIRHVDVEQSGDTTRLEVELDNEKLSAGIRERAERGSE